MPLLNLFKVTKTLVDMVSENITKNIDPSLAGLLNVIAIPPEKVTNPSNTLSIFLYHVSEDPSYKNALGAGMDVPNVARAPMALNLFYILTAHHESDSAFDAETEQKLMGYALKTFHDFPVITDSTRVNGRLILDADLRDRDNSLQVILRPVTPEEAISFWSSEETRTARLSAYYEVRVVMLEPEEPTRTPGIVLSLGAYLVSIATPQLDRTVSIVRFTLPQRNAGLVQELEASPARVTLDASAAPPEAHNRFVLHGANLTAGRSRTLALRSGVWEKLPAPDGPVSTATVDPSLNPDWRVEFRSDRASVTAAPVLRHRKPDGSIVDLPVLPGVYNAAVRAVMEEKVVANELKQVTTSSNEMAFAIAPRILGHNAPDPAGNIQINLGPEFDPLDARLPDNAVQFVAEGEVYTRVFTDPPGNAKEFFVTNEPAPLIRINPHFPVTVSTLQAHPAQIIVDGAASAPFWIELAPDHDDD